jgi:PKD repeat protein
MIRNTLYVLLAATILAAPFAASAAGVTATANISSLQAEVAALVAQIQSLQSSGSVSGSTGVASIGTTAMPVPVSCPTVTRSLSIGAQGTDVVALQQFLSAQGLLNASATGYLGVQTKAAIGTWQAQNGIATSASAGYGIFGPLSRAYLMRSCGGTVTSPVQQSFSADAQSGSAPLTVQFSTNDGITSTASYSVDFGDGQTGTLTKGSCVGIAAIEGGQGGIRCSYAVSHTYVSNGTYSARLMKNTCPAGAQCFVGPLTVATLTINVGSTVSSTTSFSASPSSGNAPLTVQFNSSAPQGTDIGSTVNFGDGTTGTLVFDPVCSSCNAAAMVSHTYAAAGTYTATLTDSACACPQGGICNCPNMAILGTVTVTVGSGTMTDSGTIKQLNAPGTVSLMQGDMAEIRNESYYFTLSSISGSSATIQVTPVGCWNYFPSDTPPQARCMLAIMPIAPITLTVGQTALGARPITLTQISSGSATFSIGTNPSQ